MKTISTELAAHIAGECLTLAQCWKLTRRDGVVLGFTNHDADITYDAITYLAATGFVPSAVESQASMAVDNMDVEGMLDSEAIAEVDVLAGLYDFAQIETFLLNYADSTQGVLQLRTGWIGEIQLNQQHFVAEVRGLTQRLSQHIGELYSPICRARLGDSRCKVDVGSYSETGAVEAVESPSKFTDAARIEGAGSYDGGEVTFRSGSNNGITREVKFFFAGGVIQTALPFPFTIAQGDIYTIIQGCDKTISTCSQKFSNAINFRGEPHVPGLDKILQTAATRQE